MDPGGQLNWGRANKEDGRIDVWGVTGGDQKAMKERNDSCLGGQF